MRRVTHLHAHAGRVACPWPIRRAIDGEPEVLSVPEGQALVVAREDGATPIDRPGARSHDRDELCTVDVPVEDHGVTGPALLRRAQVGNAADTDRREADPLAARLEAIAVAYGLRLPDAHPNLEPPLGFCDALHACCRLVVTWGDA